MLLPVATTGGMKNVQSGVGASPQKKVTKGQLVRSDVEYSREEYCETV